MPEARRILRGAAAVGAIIAYMIFAHRVASGPPPSNPATLLFAAAPIFIVILVAGWQGHRLLAIASCIAGAVLLWMAAEQVGRHVSLLYLVQNTSMDGALMLMFGSSLRRGHEPLCTRVAAMVRGELSPQIARYTRQVTVAWTAFFATLIAVSLTLYVLAPIEVWSTFSNLMTMPLICVMFIVEYVVRRRVLRDVPHSPLSAAIRAWSASGRTSDRLSAPPR